MRTEGGLTAQLPGATILLMKKAVLFFALVVVVITAACSRPEVIAPTRSALAASTAWPTTPWWNETPYWVPDQMSWPVTGWDDSLGHRVDNCYYPRLALGDLKIFDGYYHGSCAKLHGIMATAQQPFGFYFGTDYVYYAGWNGVDTVDWSSPAQIQSFIVAAGSHALLCAGSLSGPASMPCDGLHLTLRADTVDQGTGPVVPFRVTSLAVAINAPPPPLCPYLTAAGGFRPSAFIECPNSFDASGFNNILAGDGQVRTGGYAVIGNPITGLNMPLGNGYGAPCLGQNRDGYSVVFVYPVGSTAQPVCP